MSYVPNRGDVVWLDFDPQAGHEQSGRRLALVLSPQRYNQLTSLMICCPLTTAIKGYPFEVPTRIGGKEGVVLADQVNSVGWRARHAATKGRVGDDVLMDVLAKIASILT